MKLTVLSRACQGQRIIAPGWTVRRANALGNLAVVKPSGATGIGAFSYPHLARITAVSPLFGDVHEFGPGVHHQLVELPHVPGVDVHGTAWGMDDAMKPPRTHVDAAKNQAVELGLNHVTADFWILGCQSRSHDVGTNGPEGVRLPTAVILRHQGKGQSAAAVF